MRAGRRVFVGAGLATLLWPPARADLPDIVATAKASVLPVGTYSATASPRFGFRGTGFVVGDGTLVATNFHVLPTGFDLENGPTIMVMTAHQGAQAQLRKARVVASERTHDLALLKLEGAPLPALPLAAAGQAREGQAIALMGYPIGGVFGFSAVTHRGIIASITTAALPAATAQQLDPRAVLRLREGNVELYQLDATAYPGNSGGPVLDAQTGQVVGIVNMVWLKAGRESALTDPTGISYAIPVRYLQELLQGR